jgi:hypothetical protein
MEGYIKLYRKIKENKYWLEPRKFSKAEAWIDLLLRAGFKNNELVLGNQDLSLKAGEFVTSQKKLAEAWKWDRETVNVYLRRLKTDEMLDYRTSNKFTQITICNWDNYQNPEKTNPATNSTANPAAIRQQLRQQTDIKTDTINNDNNDNNDKNNNNLREILDFIKQSNLITKDIILAWLKGTPESEHGKIKRAYCEKWAKGSSEAAYNLQLFGKAEDEYFTQKSIKQ